MQAKKVSNELDDTFLRRFNTLKTEIGNEANDPAKIEVMLFFERLDELMQQKTGEQSSIPETKHDLVALAKKLRPNLDRKPKPSLPTRTRPIPSILLNLSNIMLLLPALCMKTVVGKRCFAPIVKEKTTKRQNVGGNPAILSNAKNPDSIQLEQRLLK